MIFDPRKNTVTKNCTDICENYFEDDTDCIECMAREIYKAKSCYDNSIAQKIDAYDNISKPSHYAEGRKYEPKDVIRDWSLNFNLGSAVKYISRAGRKNDTIQDLEKAIQFIQFEIDALKEERANAKS